MSWDAYSQQRSQLLQLIIRSASGDARLMNPISFAESHPGCMRNGQVGREGVNQQALAGMEQQ